MSDRNNFTNIVLEASSNTAWTERLNCNLSQSYIFQKFLSYSLVPVRIIMRSLVLSLFCTLLLSQVLEFANGCVPFINEIHYDNDGADQGEAVEIAAPAGLDLTGYKIYYYNGANSEVYATATLSGTASDSGNGWDFIQESTLGIQNGSPDGMALVDNSGNVIEFISYEGTITAVGGPVSGMTSVDIDVQESSSTTVGYSLQLSGNGCAREEFTWQDPQQNTFSSINTGQFFVGCNCQGGNVTPTPSPSQTTQTPTPRPIPIHEVQGSGLRSSYEGESVTVFGVVTGLTSSSFYLQDRNGDNDNSTSDGILVYHGSTSVSVQVGDYISVTGTVEEYKPSSAPDAQPITELTSPTIVTFSTGNILPDPVVIGPSGRLPPTSSIPDGISFYESLEFMRVIVEDPVMIGLKNTFGEYWTAVGNGSSATGYSGRGTLVIAENDFNPERVQIDYNSATLSEFPAPDAEVGDILSSVTGIVAYAFGNYEVVATEPFTVTRGPLTRQVRKIGPKRKSRLSIASINVLNLDPSDTDQFSKIAEIVVINLKKPDVIALQEIQDNDGPDNTDVTSASMTLAMLIAEIQNVGGPVYEYIDNEFIGDDTNGGQPGGNIRVAYLYRSNRIRITATEPVVDPTDQQTNPDNPFYNSRPPLAISFKSRGKLPKESFLLVNVHFSSKGGSAPVFGTRQPFSELQDDPTVNSDVDERTAQATAVRDYLMNSSVSNQIVVGDFNEFQFNVPVTTLAGDDMTILMNTLPRLEQYSYIFEGNAQALDQAVVSKNLASRVLFEAVHCNSEFEDGASDHDPLIVAINF